MQTPKRIQEKREHNATVTGVILTVAVHLCVFALVSFTGFRYIYPPPEEKSMLIDFSEDSPEVVPTVMGREPAAEEIDRSQKVEITQRSESPEVSEKENLTPETAPDDFGDVPVPTPEPEEEPKLDPRASFPGMAKKDTSLTAPHGADRSSDSFKAGQAKGNSSNGKTEGRANAHVKGRTLDKAGLKLPKYNVQESGVVVVEIWVDNYGNVVKAVPGGEGTTVLDKSLWAAARSAAMETHFNMSADAPAMQEGTITYYFNLK